MKLRKLFFSVIISLSFTYISCTPVNSIYPIIYLFMAYILMNDYKKSNNKYIKVTSIILSIFSCLSLYQVNVYDIALGNNIFILRIIKILIVFWGSYIGCCQLLIIIYSFLTNIKKKHIDIQFNTKRMFMLCFFVLLILYFITWLICYPSNVTPDTINQINQINKGIYTNHHPFLHTMWLKLLMMFGSTNSSKVAIASFIQMIIFAIVFSMLIVFVYKKTHNKKLCVFTILFYSLLSFNSFMSIALIKDSIHALITCLLVIVLSEYSNSFNKKNKFYYVILIFIFSILFCLFRSNAYYAYVFSLVIVIFMSLKNRKYYLLVCFVCAFSVSFIIKNPIYSSLGIKKASPIESLSIPVQQISFVIKNSKPLSDAQYELIDKVVDHKILGDSYETFLSDPVKNAINDGNIDYFNNNKFLYFKLWLSIGLKYPVEYIRAWVDQVSSFFSPHYYGTSVFWVSAKNNLNISQTDHIINKNIKNVLTDLSYYQHNIPILGWFHYPAFSSWIIIIAFIYALYINDYNILVCVSLLIGIFITILLSCPYNVCFRYYYSVIACIPIVIALIYGKEIKR